ncbi:hypothetical protein GB937_001739 [Aspergillus fischeri]|nr:hypothetical protein GB937_001739 [Aspergillus fischeri]
MRAQAYSFLASRWCFNINLSFLSRTLRAPWSIILWACTLSLKQSLYYIILFTTSLYLWLLLKQPSMLVLQLNRPISLLQTLLNFMAGCMFLSLFFLLMVKRCIYELFLRTHQGCAIFVPYAIWKYVLSSLKNIGYSF